MIIYISGKITGKFNYLEPFMKAEQRLKAMRHIVINPTCMPKGLSYEQYMIVDLAMVEVSDAIIMLYGWESSKGAVMEFEKAKELDKLILIEQKDGSYEPFQGKWFE